MQNKIEFNNARLFQMHFHVNLCAFASFTQQQSGIHIFFFTFRMKCKFIFVKKNSLLLFVYMTYSLSGSTTENKNKKKNNRSFESSNVIVRNKNQSIESTNQSTEFFWVILFLYDMNVQKKKNAQQFQWNAIYFSPLWCTCNLCNVIRAFYFQSIWRAKMLMLKRTWKSIRLIA